MNVIVSGKANVRLTDIEHEVFIGFTWSIMNVRRLLVRYDGVRNSD